MKGKLLLSLLELNAPYAQQLKEAALRVIDSGWYLRGKETASFESEMASYLGVSHVVGVANGLDALRLIFKAYIEMGCLQPEDEVIVPANTFIASVLAITDNRLKPRFVEPNVHTHNLDISLIEQAITPRTKAVLVVHLYGRPCWDSRLEEIARRHNLLIIEDNAQALGARLSDGRRTGALGDAAGTSFYPGKNLGALGDAGMVSTSNKQLAEIVEMLANYGGMQKYIYPYQGLNSRIDELQAAFLRVKLPYLDTENTQRTRLAQMYNEGIRNKHIMLPEIPEYDTHVWHQYVVRVECRDKFMNYLQEHDIPSGIHYPIPPHLQEAYKSYNNVSLPITQQLAQEVVSLPIASYFPHEEIQQAISIINAFDK